MNSLVSVCLLTYNHEKYIEDTIQGIIDQTYSPLELIVLDDASSDNTVNCIKEKLNTSKSRFQNVKLIVHDTNSGNIPKSHMKISGQFDSEKTARYYADVKTYVETYRKNGINEMKALTKLCEGNPYTVEEIFA